jgi:hypothetical protein
MVLLLSIPLPPSACAPLICKAMIMTLTVITLGGIGNVPASAENPDISSRRASE